MEVLSRQPVVVVEDDAQTRKLLQRQLEAAGYEVRACEDGRAALEPISTMGTGIVIADWSMPEMDGVQLCRAVRELQEMQAVGHIYFVLLTAHNTKDKVIEGLDAGANDYLTKPYHVGELLARVQVGQRMLVLQKELMHRTIEVQKANAEMAVLAAKLEQLANTDGLTRLPNRRCLFGRFQEAWDNAVRDNQPLSLIMVDVDRFKNVNDTYGHATGDEVLEVIAATLHHSARRPDLCGRFGGEEFVLICPATDLAEAAQLAEHVRQAVAAQPLASGETVIPVTISCGVAERGPNTRWPDDLIRAADSMLYAAKEHGRNQTWALGSDGLGRRVGQPNLPAAAPVRDSAAPPSASCARRKDRPDRVQSAHAAVDHE